ncbi:MAG TPA: AarF/ABC1/UbiB kinase family protein [Minicystis sp.]|nr:AarF/ABC1/UbiB kinase family protein [Minicystis sp.]
MGDIPTSRIGRFARLAALGTRAGAERLVSAVGDKKAEARLAATAAEALGTMRGLALKLGQMASYVDGAVPEEHKDTYEAALRKLRAAAPPMPKEAALRVLTRELGAPPDALFASFEIEPFAAASIGQVHRAALKDGREVAVKVQYEGVAAAVQSDLKNASLFTSLAGPLASRVRAKDQLAELRARFEEELDYGHEAARQRRFAEVFRGDARVRVPEVVDELSTARVLTTTFARGVGFEAACAASEDERRAWAETLWRFVSTSMLGHGLFNADPHPGNYLFSPGGVVHFLDFGCTREIRAERMDDLRGSHRAAVEGDLTAFVACAFRMLDVAPYAEQERLSREYLLACFEPLFARGPFHMTRAYTKRLYDDMMHVSRQAVLGRIGQFEPIPPEWLFFNRLQLGFYSVLARLDVPVDYAAVERSVLDRFAPVAAPASPRARARVAPPALDDGGA